MKLCRPPLEKLQPPLCYNESSVRRCLLLRFLAALYRKKVSVERNYSPPRRRRRRRHSLQQQRHQLSSSEKSTHRVCCRRPTFKGRVTFFAPMARLQSAEYPLSHIQDRDMYVMPPLHAQILWKCCKKCDTALKIKPTTYRSSVCLFVYTYWQQKIDDGRRPPPPSPPGVTAATLWALLSALVMRQQTLRGRTYAKWISFRSLFFEV